MAARFHIEELISQDSSGVIFRAKDLEAGTDVTVRRFFPRGMGEGGLQEEERTAFDIAVQRFTCAIHPALRGVIAGGCDPVDGVPFIVSEWVEGTPISQQLAGGPLQTRRAIDILMGALEVSEVISELLAEQAVWVETDPASIIEAPDDAKRGTTFGISPFKWLGSDEERRSLKPLIQLTEDLMGWKNKLVNDQTGNGLALWLKWLKQHAFQATLAETRENLAAATGAPPPPPTSRLVRQSTRPMVPRAATVQVQMVPIQKAKASKTPAILGVTGLLIALGIGGWIAKTGEVPFKKFFQARAAAAQPPVRKSALDYAPPLPSQYDEEEEKEAPAAAAAEPAPTSTPPAADSSSGTVYQVKDSDEVLKKLNQNVTLEGKLTGVSRNPDKTQIFLQFEMTERNDACGFVMSRDATGPLDFDELTKLVGKTIRIRGKVGVGAGKFGKRPKIQIFGRESITVVP
ncbi:MAG: hypothetical protein KF712_08810 [Akkermansiaceae bacterium]|nr:hypothetical protein [Akkermansiaceae bacterium]